MKQTTTERLENGNIKLTIAVDLQFIGNGKRIVQPDGSEQQDSVRKILLTAIARGRRWQSYIDDGTVATVKEIAERIGCNESYVARLMRLSLISPSIIRKIIAGDYPPGLTINRARKSLPLIWTEQEKILLK
jgi:ParB-like chromosome segregation protein Spo0J